MARDPEDLETDDVLDEAVFDDEAVIDEEPAEHPLVDSPGLGQDLPEADVLDQWREVELDAEDDAR
jgi:hypothetical protein